MLSPLASVFILLLFHITVPMSFATEYSSTATDYRLRKQCLFSKSSEESSYTFVPGFGYYKVHINAAVWNEAYKICKSEGAYLAVPNSEEEAEAIREVISNAGTYIGTPDVTDTLIGFRYNNKEGRFLNIFRTPLEESGFYIWSEGEPNNLNNREYCGSVKNSDGYYNDIDCDRPYGFICELEH